MKKIFAAVVALATFGVAWPAFAHVIVKPDTVGIGKYQTFTVSVPNEKKTPTIGMRLVLPEGIDTATPTVKPGWNIEVKGNEINWTGGSIPVGERDDFTFSAKAPANPTELNWKAYQTYQDGSVVSWDQTPSSAQNGEESTPYSTTKVINDLTPPAPQQNTSSKSTQNIAYAALGLSLIALLAAIRSNIRK